MFENFFLVGELPLIVETGTYIPALVLLSYVMASFGSFTGLTFAVEMFKAKTPKQKNSFHDRGAITLGAGIWSMHFIGMLAYKMDMKLSYDPFLTIFSMVVAIVVAYGALWVTRSEKFRIAQVIPGSVLLGLAICTMHYTGMAAMEVDADLRYIPSIFFLSVAIAIVASGAALTIIFYLGLYEGKWKNHGIILAGLVMGAAICGMHYTGMAASVFIPWADCRYDPEQSFELLALFIAFATSVIFGVPMAMMAYDKEKSAFENQETQEIFPAKFLFPVLLFILIAVLWASRP